MSIKIGIPNREIYNPLIEQFEQIKAEYDLQLFRDTEDRLAELFSKKKLDFAILNPIGYANGIGIADYRIVQQTCLAYENYTGELSIYFNRNAHQFKSMATAKETDYLTVIARIILAERYDSFPEIKEMKVDLQTMLEKCDTAVVWQGSTGNDFALDISENWFDTYEFPLPIGFWVCRADDHPEKINEIIAKLVNPEMPDEYPIMEHFHVADTEYERDGNVHYRWSEDIEAALNETMQLLFVLNILEAVPEIKLLTKDV